jgi:hypothetical protein
MSRSIRNIRISPASILAMVALFVALGGVSYAAATIGSAQIKDNSIRSKDVRNGTLTGKDVGADKLGGDEIAESSLGKVPSATAADTATSATSATTASSAQNADLAANAAIAHSIVDNTVSGSKVQNGSLTGKDVGRQAGNTNVAVGVVAANACKQLAVDIDPTDADMRDDAFAMTAESTWPLGLLYSTENSTSVGFVRIDVCNVTNAAVDAGSQTFHWVAFDS